MNHNHNDYKKIQKISRTLGGPAYFLLWDNKTNEVVWEKYDKRFKEYAPLVYINNVEAKALYQMLFDQPKLRVLNGQKNMFYAKVKDKLYYFLIDYMGQIRLAVPLGIKIQDIEFESTSDVIEYFREYINNNKDKFILTDNGKEILCRD